MDLQEKSAAVAVKICGLTTVADTVCCLRLGVDYVGFNVYPRSKRYIPAAAAAAVWRAALEEHDQTVHTQPVAVVVGPTLAGVDDLLRVFPALAGVQVHGAKQPELLALQALMRARGGLLWQAIGVRSVGDVAVSVQAAALADLILFDSPAVPAGQVVAGGSGQTFAWGALAGCPPSLAFGVAGGLRPDNLADLATALAGRRPQLIDICSGVEYHPGCKSHQLIAAAVMATAALW